MKEWEEQKEKNEGGTMDGKGEKKGKNVDRKGQGWDNGEKKERLRCVKKKET